MIVISKELDITAAESEPQISFYKWLLDYFRRE